MCVFLVSEDRRTGVKGPGTGLVNESPVRLNTGGYRKSHTQRVDGGRRIIKWEPVFGAYKRFSLQVWNPTVRRSNREVPLWQGDTHHKKGSDGPFLFVPSGSDAAR